MHITTIAWTTTVDLRRTVLGYPSSPLPGDLDADTVHLAIVDDADRALAVASTVAHACPEIAGTPATYFWAMAVDERYQKRGLGRQLLAEVLERARSSGADVVWADARSSAVPFYERCGARAVGEPYIDDVTGLVDRRVVFDLHS